MVTLTTTSAAPLCSGMTPAGLGLGLSVMRAAQEGTAPATNGTTSSAPAATCTSCSRQTLVGYHLCPSCSTSSLGQILSAHCQKPLPPTPKFCAGCGTATAGGTLV